MKPTVNFVLHAHLPWVKGAGVWPFGQEWLYQAMLGTYVPLLDMLGRLRAAGIRGAIVLGITPVLIEMLRDPLLQMGFDRYLDARVELLEADIVAFGSDEQPLRKLALGARAAIQNVRKRWRGAYKRDLAGSFADFAETGQIEIITSAATHAYLPLLESQAAVEAQIANGIAVTADAFGKRPAGFWLPECAFVPELLDVLERFEMQFFYADERALRQAVPNVNAAFAFPGSPVSYFVRNPLARGELADSDLGYPGNSWYREFYKRHERSGMRYWRVTARDCGLGEKEPYEPARALEQLRLHANDFVRKIESLGNTAEQAHLTFTFDAELFGHWWAEGILWLEETLVQVHYEGAAVFEFPSSYLQRHRGRTEFALPASSWGAGGDNRTWANPQTRSYWEAVHGAQNEFTELLGRADAQSPLMQQAARELFLLQSSDWPFLISTGTAGEYPVQRFRTHAARFAECSRALRNRPHDPKVVQEAMRDDALFAVVETHPYARAAARA
ncbi:MAG: DUF1957 domain-containing protein [Candidatus Eremiobacteraeota bacterium]|nr:DUF1957 domain-containing protein [Candidatus Eremiobacteraeota bacterium]